MTAALCNLVAASWHPASRLQQEELLAGVLAPLLSDHGETREAPVRSRREHPAARRAKEYLQAHYAEEVPLQALADIASLSPYHLARVFRDAVGLPPHAYQTHLRLVHARKLLRQGLDVSSVAQLRPVALCAALPAVLLCEAEQLRKGGEGHGVSRAARGAGRTAVPDQPRRAGATRGFSTPRPCQR